MAAELERRRAYYNRGHRAQKRDRWGDEFTARHGGGRDWSWDGDDAWKDKVIIAGGLVVCALPDAFQVCLIMRPGNHIRSRWSLAWDPSSFGIRCR
jgi:hypothetical protein